MKFSSFLTCIIGIICISTFLLANTNLHAQVMQSTSYQIQSDSLNFGGGYSSSTNYQQESTFGEVGTGVSGSASYNLYAGYQQMQQSAIAITGAADVVLNPNIGGVSGGTSTGAVTLTITTDNPGGYELTIASPNSPAMSDGVNTIADYVPATADPDFQFTTDNTDAHFGYSPEGADIVQRFKDDGGDCNVDTTDTTNRCWDGLSTTPETIASDTNANHPAGTDTTIRFQVGVGGVVNQVPGVYVATTTITAIPL